MAHSKSNIPAQNPPKILFYDIETSPLKAYVWGLGKQVVRHPQLDKAYSQYGIICVTYCWNDGKPAKCIDWDYKKQDSKAVIKEFDKIIRQADFTIGKNNKRFDEKMINAVRMFSNLPGLPEWVRYSDDLEQQMRRYFRLPSQSLDYISDQLGLGGKIKMEFQDWIDIVEQNKNGLKAFKKMCKYGIKDVEDTRTIWNKLITHFDPKFNHGAFLHGNWTSACKYCGSTDIRINGSFMSGSVRRTKFTCKTCKHYAGSRPTDWKKGKLT